MKRRNREAGYTNAPDHFAPNYSKPCLQSWARPYTGVLEEGAGHKPVTGTPQGGVISSMLSNIFLHHVLDKWFEEVARPRLRGNCWLVRFADDFVVALEDRHSGKRLLDVLGKRLGRYGAHAP